MRIKLMVAMCALLVASRASAIPYGWDAETIVTGPFPITDPIPFDFQGFDPARGTLLGVFIQTVVWVSGDALFTNPTPDPIVPWAYIRFLAFASGDGWYHAVDEWNLFAAADEIPPGGSQVVHFDGVASNDPGSSGPYYSTAFVTMDRVPGWLTPSGLGPFDSFMGIDPDVTGQIDQLRVLVRYDFEPAATVVPEPASLVLLAGGAAVLFARRRTLRAH